MSQSIKVETHQTQGGTGGGSAGDVPPPPSKKKSKDKEDLVNVKRRCVSTACIACRKRKSKCDGNLPSCAACASVYHTPCVYDPGSDHRRKGVYKKDIDNLKTRNSTLQTLIQAILNYSEEDVKELVHQIRTCENLEDVAETVVAKEKGIVQDAESPDSPIDSGPPTSMSNFEAELSYRMGDMVLEGSVKFVGGTSNLVFLPTSSEFENPVTPMDGLPLPEDPITSWTTVTKDRELIAHLLNMYFTWHYAYFTTLSKELFYRDFLQGRPSQYCSGLLVNAMLALGCHFTAWPGARAKPGDPATAGDHFFKEAKRLLMDNDELEKARLCTVQGLALMSVREAGCAREGKGWVYSGMSFRMAYDLGLNVEASGVTGQRDPGFTDEDIDARRITYWGCFLFDKCWSNYLGRQPQLTTAENTIPKPGIFPHEEADTWVPYTDSGRIEIHAQPARTRAVALQISLLCEISSDLIISFYHPIKSEKPSGKQAELKKLSDIHTRLETWRKNLPKEMEPRDGQLPQVLLMHMFFQLLFIHLYRPFLKYTQSTSPLPSHVSPRKLCTQAAATISKLFRLYKRTHGLHQVCNIAIYIIHSACTIHLLNLPDKNARRDVTHGVKHLEEIAEYWLAARRTLRILHVSSERWKIELPEEAAATFSRTLAKYGPWGSSEQAQSPSTSVGSPPVHTGDYSASPHPGDFAESPVPQLAENMVAQSQSNMQPQRPLTAYNTQSGTAPFGNRAASGETSQMPQTGNYYYQQSAQPAPVSTQPELQIPAPANVTQTPAFSQAGNFVTPMVRPQPRPTSQPQPRPISSSSFELTQQQQDAWNGHQARRASASLANKNFATATQGAQARAANNSASVLFGGIGSLVEENREWWLKDQSSLAMGFGNWGGNSATTSSENVPTSTSIDSNLPSRLSQTNSTTQTAADSSTGALNDLDLDMSLDSATLANITAGFGGSVAPTNQTQSPPMFGNMPWNGDASYLGNPYSQSENTSGNLSANLSQEASPITNPTPPRVGLTSPYNTLGFSVPDSAATLASPTFSTPDSNGGMSTAAGLPTDSMQYQRQPQYQSQTVYNHGLKTSRSQMALQQMQQQQQRQQQQGQFGQKRQQQPMQDMYF